jgi:hypothetical protein
MPGLIRWRRKDLLVPPGLGGPFPSGSASPGGGCNGGGRINGGSHNQERQTMAKNGPGVALNRPQDTERYNAKDSIVKRAVKCSCLVRETKWAAPRCLALLRLPFILRLSPLSLPLSLVTSSSIRGKSRIIQVAETAAILSSM